MGSQVKPKELLVGVDIGGTKILAGVATDQGKLLAREYVATSAEEGPQAVIGRIVAAIKAVSHGVEGLGGIGIAVAGLVESGEGVVVTSPNLPGWSHVPLGSIVGKELGLPAYLINDANAAALGEHRFGAGRGVSNLVYVSVGTGIGGGIVIGGRLYTGGLGTAGEIGHMTIETRGPVCQCGNRGCWETLASGTAVAREARKRLQAGARPSLRELAGENPENITAQAVFLAAQRGDRVARGIIVRAGTYLGVGLASMVNIFGPELIVIGGGMAQMGDMLLKPALKEMKRRAFETPAQAVRVVPAQLGEDAGVLGAVAYVLEKKGAP
jgi:glucokinase